MSYIEIQAINKKIRNTEEAIKSLIDCQDDNIRITMTSELGKRLESLQRSKEEIEKSMAKETVTLRIYGEKVQAGKISSRVLLSVLNGFQSMTDSIANSMHNLPTSRGRIPADVKEITDFEVVGTFAGSFGITLEKQHEQYAVQAGSMKLNQVLNEMFNVLETVDNSDQLLGAIAPHGKRTVMYYRQWLDELKESDVNLELKWRDDAANYRKMNVIKEKASAIVSTLDSIDKIDNHQVVFQGVLNGVNVRSHSFEMSVDGVGLIKGTALLETLIAATDRLGKEITANLIRSTSYTKVNVQKVTWYLSSINE